MNLVLLLLFATIVIKVTLCDEPVKCCGAEEILVKQNNSYNCSKDVTQRHQIYVKSFNFLHNNVSGSCIDVFNNDFVTYDVDTDMINLYKGAFFPKCCPINRIYNSDLHSCVENQSTNIDFINTTFIKVGLPNCKIIADLDFEYRDFQYNLTNLARNKSSRDDYNSFCIDRNDKNSFVFRDCQDFEKCKEVKCIKKCCPDGQSFVNGPKCVDTYEHGLNLSSLKGAVENHEEKFAIIHNRTCRQIYIISNNSNITVHKDGSFSDWITNTPRIADVTNMNSYCIEHRYGKNVNGFYFFHCFVDDESLTKFDARLWPLVLSCIFLILTVLVYVIIKEYKKMFGKILIDYCLASFILFAILLWNQIFPKVSTAECQIKSFLLIFFALAQFTWANVLSFEIWCTFGSTKFYLGSQHKEMELKKFLLYSVYAWGVPLVLTLTVFLFYHWRILPDVIQPYLGHNTCFFEYRDNNYAKFLFFSIPLLLIQIVNTVFFIKTVICFIKVKNEINKINDAAKTHSTKKFQHDKERLFLIIKLSIVMGISYIWEVGTGFVNMSKLGEGPKYAEIVLDIYNALQGVFVFIIFICKKKMFIACLQIFHNPVSRTQKSASTRPQSSQTINGVILDIFSNKDNVNNNKAQI